MHDERWSVHYNMSHWLPQPSRKHTHNITDKHMATQDISYTNSKKTQLSNEFTYLHNNDFQLIVHPFLTSLILITLVF
jgi:hypothetical protein